MRHKVKRDKYGLPFDGLRCDAPVSREGQLFPDRCKRARRRGYLYCGQHLKIARKNAEWAVIEVRDATS